MVHHGHINEACRRDVKEWSQTPESSTKQPCLWEVQKPTKPIAGVQRLNGTWGGIMGAGGVLVLI